MYTLLEERLREMERRQARAKKVRLVLAWVLSVVLAAAGGYNIGLSIAEFSFDRGAAHAR